MVTAWEGQDELSWALQCLEHSHSVGLQVRWRDHRRHVVQDVRVLLEQEGALLLHDAVELLPVALGHTVPQLGLAKVAVVDRGEHEVLVVPAKGGVFHADVDPGHVDAGHIFHRLELKHRVSLALEVVEVPAVILEGIPAAVAVQLVVSAAEAAAVFVGVEVGGVLHLDLLAHLVVDDVPISAFNVVVYVLIVVPVDVLVLLLPLLGDPLEVLKGVADPILMERLSLGELLQDLVSCRQPAITVDVKAEFWFETLRRHNLDTSVLMDLL